jgi:hypothetical protein
VAGGAVSAGSASDARGDLNGSGSDWLSGSGSDRLGRSGSDWLSGSGSDWLSGPVTIRIGAASVRLYIEMHLSHTLGCVASAGPR